MVIVATFCCTYYFTLLAFLGRSSNILGGFFKKRNECYHFKEKQVKPCRLGGDLPKVVKLMFGINMEQCTTIHF